MFILKKRKYNWLDMWRIPFICAPLSTVTVTVQKLFTALANVFQVIVVAEFLDSAIAAVKRRNFDGEIVRWLFLLLLIVGWKRVSYYIGALFTSHVIIQGTVQISAELTRKQDRMEYFLLEDPATEELYNRVALGLEGNIHRNLQGFLNFFMICLPRIIGVLLIMAGYVWLLALIVLLLMCPLFFLSVKSGNKVYHTYEKEAAYRRRYKYLSDILTGREATEERSLFGFSGQLNEKWHEQYEEARKLEIRGKTISAKNSLRNTAINGLFSMVVVLIMIPLALSGRLTAGIFISLSTSMYELIELVGGSVSNALNQIASTQKYMKDLTAFAALPEREDFFAGKQAQKKISELKELEFCHVTFRYPGADTDVLKDFSMKLQKGKHYAVVGENGAGKTTLIKLLTGLYRNYEGEILYNGMEMRTFDREEWFLIFSCVFQDFARYCISVEENICLGMGHMNFEVQGEKTKQKGERIARMEYAAKQLNMHEDISKLKFGYKTKLGKLDDESVDLSGGQWQRVAMARALMNDAPLLLLDEPTAALDPISESKLYEEFGEISRNRTTIFISHRLGSTKLADYIFVLKDGCVREQGSHEELMNYHGIYADMYQTQQEWYSQKEVWTG